jgi:hypothetical protein
MFYKMIFSNKLDLFWTRSLFSCNYRKSLFTDIYFISYISLVSYNIRLTLRVSRHPFM